MKCVLTVAGSDSGAAAGIQADIKAIAANGGYGVTVVTAVTAQNADTVKATMAVPAEIVTAQLQAVSAGFEIAAVKSGILVDAERVQAVAGVFKAWKPPNYVLDPVIASTSGHALLSSDGVDTMVRDLLPLAALATPNIPEAERLSGRAIRSLADVRAAGKAILRLGCAAVLVKGGHLAAAPATDVLVAADGIHVFKGDFVADAEPRGTGCTLSAAIATRLGQGDSLIDAITVAKRYVAEAIACIPSGTGNSPLDHFHAVRERLDSLSSPDVCT